MSISFTKPPPAAQPYYHTNPMPNADPLDDRRSAAPHSLFKPTSPASAGENGALLHAPFAALEKPTALRESAIPGSSAHKLAATLDSLFARNPWQWTYCVTINLDPSV